MTLGTARLIICIATTVLFSILASAQFSVDATKPARLTRRVMAGGGSSIGRKLPVDVAIKLNSNSADDHGASEVIFLLTNTSENELSIPVSPHSGDFEPADPNVGYTIAHLGLNISSFFKGRYTIFPGGVSLFGNAAAPGTMVKLAPGESIKVRCRVILPSVSGLGDENDIPIRASASLATQTVSVTNGKPFSNLQNIGYAQSREYSLQSFFKLQN